MRIAEIAPVWVPVPPPNYGGIELMVGLLADGLAARGHDVTLFASGGSSTRARLVSPFERPPDLADLGKDVTADLVHTMQAYLEAGDFDVIHDHTGLGPVMGAVLDGRPPVVHTLHGPWNDSSRTFYRQVGDRVHLVAISHAQAAGNPDVRIAGVVHNGVDPDAYPWREEASDGARRGRGPAVGEEAGLGPRREEATDGARRGRGPAVGEEAGLGPRREEATDQFLLFLGRCNPEKGPEVAVEVAKRANVPLVMAMKRAEHDEIAHWERHVEPRLRGDEQVFFDVGHDAKVDLLRRASATLFPIQWEEPFGLVMVESMACGTPVIATPRGSAPEVVVDGVTGILATGVDAMADAVGRTGELSPEACREHVVAHFSADAMVEGYERVFDRVTAAARV